MRQFLVFFLVCLLFWLPQTLQAQVLAGDRPLISGPLMDLETDLGDGNNDKSRGEPEGKGYQGQANGGTLIRYNPICGIKPELFGSTRMVFSEYIGFSAMARFVPINPAAEGVTQLMI